MGSKNCMNEACRTTMSSEWKKGWSLKSGGFAPLCHNCGLAYENSVFCETFHFKESGWRECKLCGKIIHCGCTASRYLYEYMDFGGISCLSCAKHLEIQPVQPVQTPSDLSCGPFMTNGVKDVCPLVTEHKRNDDKFSTERLLQLTNAVGATDVISKLEQLRREEYMLKTVDTQKCISNLRQQCSSPAFLKTDIGRSKREVKDIYKSLSQQSLNFSLATPLGSSSSALPFVGEITVEQSKSCFQRCKSTKHALSKPVKNSIALQEVAAKVSDEPSPDEEGEIADPSTSKGKETVVHQVSESPEQKVPISLKMKLDTLLSDVFSIKEVVSNLKNDNFITVETNTKIMQTLENSLKSISKDVSKIVIDLDSCTKLSTLNLIQTQNAIINRLDHFESTISRRFDSVEAQLSTLTSYMDIIVALLSDLFQKKIEKKEKSGQSDLTKKKSEPDTAREDSPSKKPKF